MKKIIAKKMKGFSETILLQNLVFVIFLVLVYLITSIAFLKILATAFCVLGILFNFYRLIFLYNKTPKNILVLEKNILTIHLIKEAVAIDVSEIESVTYKDNICLYCIAIKTSKRKIKVPFLEDKFQATEEIKELISKHKNVSSHEFQNKKTNQ